MAARRRGRPPKKPSERKGERLDLRVSPEEKRAFNLAAQKANQDLSVWIRIQLHLAAGGEVNTLDSEAIEATEWPAQ